MYSLYDHQTDLVKAIRNKFSQGKKSVMVVSPPGSGKSVIIADIVRKTTKIGNRVLFLVHRKELAEQIRQDFIKNEANMDYVDIYTIKKAKNRLDQLKEPTLIITDEAHHALAITYTDIYEYFPKAKSIGFTATPWRLSGKGFQDVYDCMVEGKTVQWLIDNHFLADYDYYAPKLINDKKLVKNSSGDFTQDSMDEAMNGKAFGDVVKYYKQTSEGDQAILYAHSIDESKLLAAKFDSEGVSAVHVDSNTSAKDRDKMMSQFKNGNIKVLCNVDLISEGFNVPDCRTVIMMRPTQSLVLFIQQSMRSMRYKPNKKAVILDHVGNIERHNPPSMNRDWHASFVGKEKGNAGISNTVEVATCPNCHKVLIKPITKCPGCGHDFKVLEGRSHLKLDEQEELEKVDVKKLNFKVNYLLAKKPKDLKTVEEIDEYRKLKDYKPGWAYHQKKLKGLLK